jgi:hypothetical protein
MTRDSDPLPPDSAGSKSKFAEYGLGQTQARWVAGALDMVIFGDERDVSLAYDPKKTAKTSQNGPRNGSDRCPRETPGRPPARSEVPARAN